MSSKPITVFIVDDHPLFRQGLHSIFKDEPDFEVIGEAGTGREAVAQYLTHQPDVIVMDIQMPELDGIEATAVIRKYFPLARIVILTTYEGGSHALRAIKAGAAGYMLKSKVRKDLLDVIRAVHAGEQCIMPVVAVAVTAHLGHGEPLTSRELQVIELAAVGKTNRLIGVQLGISEATVSTHMRNVLAKMGANDRTHAVVLALDRGLIDFRKSAT
ncbi:response regulator [Pseudoduganella sp. FT26W]|uniref:Response regulator n=1 Tax=Duganella aquatilis TaxID=2666082 RepID=A0A844D635_9BURK|nr:response regulator transcription factor [Duganella aquatilis]MRW82649.1 response regulator [Duganella aquatilis]